MKNILKATVPFMIVFLGLLLSHPRVVEASGDPVKGKAV